MPPEPVTPPSDAPKVDAPKVDAPKVDAPPADAPKVDAPKVDAPKVDAPKVDAPKVDAPKVDEPKVDAPKVDAPGAPEKYEAFTVPEGVTLEADVVEAFTDVAKTLGLPQDKAQVVIDKMAPALKARGEAAFAQTKADLLAASNADAEIGGEKFGESVAIAKLAIDAYFAPDFAKFLNETGLGNHPEMIRGLRKAGMSLRPDGWTPGTKSTDVPKDARSFYPNSKMSA